MRKRSGRSRWTVLGFLAGSFLILLLVCHQFLIPALLVAQGIDDRGRKHLAAISALVLAIVLVCLLAGMILIIRPGRFFLPRRPAPKTRTIYTDAWAESARRLKTPDDDPDE